MSPDVPEGGETQAPRRQQTIALGALVLTLLPIVVAAVRAVRSGWVPVGDNAVVAIRARDVLGSGELPLVGTWSSKSWAIKMHMHHPGPMFFDALAVPARLWPGPTGLVIGAALINSAAVLGIFIVARRRGGPLLAAAAMVIASLLGWSMGSAVLAEPWNVSALLLPCLCYCLLAWSVASGDLKCLPWIALVGSFLVQSNLAFILVVVGLPVVGLLIVWRHRHDVADGSLDWRRPTLATGAVLLVCWARPLYEQFSGDDYGNMTRLARGSLKEAPTLGAGDAIGVVAKVLALPPWWGRPSYHHAFAFSAFGNQVPPVLVSLVALSALAGLLWVALRDARRRSDAALTTLLVTALALLVITLVTSKLTPRTHFYGTTAYQLRWLWPIGAFLAFALLATPLRRLAASRPELARPALVALVAVVGVLGILNLPFSNQGTTASPATLAVAEEVVADVGATEWPDSVMVDCAESVFDPYCEAVLAELQRRDVPFVMRDIIALQQVGLRRRWNGSNADAVVTVTTGDAAIFPPVGARQISLHEALSEKERTELFFLQQDFMDAARAGRLRLNERGLRVAARGDLPSVSVDPSSGEASLDAELLLPVRDQLFGEYRRDLVALAREDLLDVHGVWAERLRRYADLQLRWDEQTVAVFLTPL